MTTITINNVQNFPKTEFESASELFIYLRNKLSPVSIFLVDEEDIPEAIRLSIREAEKEGEDNVIDFKG